MMSHGMSRSSASSAYTSLDVTLAWSKTASVESSISSHGQILSRIDWRPWAKGHEEVQRAITYFTNQSGAGRMDYASRVAANEPIGSGVTEAACKVIVKQRLCGSGMKWTEGGAAVVLSLRTLSYTPGRWDEFWSKVDRWGFPVAA